MRFKLGCGTTPASDRPKDLEFLMSDAGRAFAGELDLAVLSLDGDVPGVLEEFAGEVPANHDHAANFQALRDVLGLVTFVVEAYEDNGKLYGYWHGPEGAPLREAPIVSYDSEGTVSLESGESLLEALVCKASYEDDDKFAALQKKLAERGVAIGATSWKNWGRRLPCKSDPEKLHDELYRKYSAAG
jgi:hypothetical protein